MPAGTGIGHVHLKVSDIDRAIAFYTGVLGFDQIVRLGDHAAFVSAGGYHHHIGLNTWQSRRGTPAPPHHKGVADHGVSESIYLADLDGNGIELTRDRPESEWPRDADGNIALAMADPLDLDALLHDALQREPRVKSKECFGSPLYALGRSCVSASTWAGPKSKRSQ